MPATNRNTLKSWFERGDKPLATQFAALIDAYWHKDEDAIPMAKIENLINTLNGLAPLSAIEQYDLIVVDTAPGVLTLDLNHRIRGIAMADAAIAGAKTWSFANDEKARHFFFRFNVTDLHAQTMPAGVKMPLVGMPSGIWDDAAKTWTPVQAGDYEASITDDGTTKYITIEGPF